jgi:hypothetical protein
MSSARKIPVRQPNALAVFEMDFEMSRALMNAVHLDASVAQDIERVSKRPAHWFFLPAQNGGLSRGGDNGSSWRRFTAALARRGR